MSVESGRLAKKDIFGCCVIQLPDGLYTLEPYDFHHTGTVRKKSDETRFGSFSLYVEADKFAFYLKRWHIVTGEIYYAIDRPTVDIMCWIMVKKVIISFYTEIFIKNLGSLRPDAAQIFYVHSSQSVHASCGIVEVTDKRGIVRLWPCLRGLSPLYCEGRLPRGISG